MNTREILSSGRQQLVQTATIFTGRMFAAILGFIVSLLVARLLGPVDFGLFSLFLTLLIVGANVLGEGFTPAIVHFYNRYAPQSISRANAVLSSALAWRLLLSVPVGIAGWAAGNWIAEAGFSEPAYGLPIGMGFMGACGAALWGITLAGLQATESFSLYAVVTPLINVLRLVSVALLIGIGQFTLSAVLGFHVAIYFVGALLGVWILRRHLFSGKVYFSEVQDQWSFGKWTAFGTLLLIIQTHMGIPIIVYYSDARAAGIFSAGANLLIILDHFTTAVLTVQLPAVSRLTRRSEYLAYIRRSLLLYVTVILAFIPFVFLARPAILFLYGPQYEESVFVLQVLFFGYLATLLTHPLYLVFLSMKRPHIYTTMAVTSFVGWLLAAALLIPSLAAEGAAWSLLFARLVQAAVIGYMLWHVLRKVPQLCETETKH